MLKQNTECHIVNTASALGLITTAGNSPYTVTKHGVVALSEALYRELKQGGHNIGVSVICSGIIRTNILKAERNRPVELKNKPGEGLDISSPDIRAFLKTSEQLLENGIPPQQVADIVFSAIRDKQFYLLPNAENHKTAIQARLEDILQERNPTILTPDME